jgi:hypothetical protein
MQNLEKERSLTEIRSLLDQLVATMTGSIGIGATSDDGLDQVEVVQGRELMQQFLNISNPRARALIVELVRAVGMLKPK